MSVIFCYNRGKVDANLKMLKKINESYINETNFFKKLTQSVTAKTFQIFSKFMGLIIYLLKISILNKNLVNTFYAKHTCRINFALTRNVTKF